MTEHAHDKKVIIGQNESGWWAANPEPAIASGDIEQIELLVESVATRDELIDFLLGIGYKREHIAEGILRL